MIRYEDALCILRRAGEGYIFPVENIPLEKIVGRICAQNVSAPIANQPFDNSAMDGYAVRAEDLRSASEGAPVMLRVIGHIAAGETGCMAALQRGECYEIMTGAPVPAGCDAVVPVEKTEKAAEGGVVFQSSVPLGNQIRRAGEDIQQGDEILKRGDELTASHILALATLGIGSLDVFKRPKVGFISTGAEVVDDFELALLPGQIYNSTGPYLRAVLPSMNVDLVSYGTIHDDEDAYLSVLQKAIDDRCDVIVSTGAVSAGTHDFVPAVAKSMGAEVFFHKVAIRPGKPIFFAKFPGRGPFLFGLPGNPAASTTGLHFFVQPFLRALASLPPELPRLAVLAKDYRKGDHDLRFFLRAELSYTNRGETTVVIPESQQSFKVSPFLSTNGWAVIPEEKNFLQSGEMIEIYQ
jgi:molybdopterin molybdotransferase